MPEFYSQVDLNLLMKALDLNGSGYIEQEEFVKLVEMVGGAVVDESGVIKYSLTLGAAQA